MSVEFTCGNPAALAGFLYNECDAAEREAIEAHLAVCPSCVEELKGLGAARTALATWAPPDAPLGFRITSAAADESRVLRPARWWQQPMPAWAQVAAAILIFATGAALGMRGGQPPAVPAGTSTTTVASTVSAKDLAALEARLRTEMTTLRAATVNRPTGAVPQAAAASSGDAAVLQRVRTLLSESEERQQRELALRLTQVMRDVDVQRRMDLTRIEQTFGRMEGLTRPELADQRQMINYLIQRTGMTRPPQEE